MTAAHDYAENAEQTVLADVCWIETVRCRAVYRVPARLLDDPQGAVDWLTDNTDELNSSGDDLEETRAVSVAPVRQLGASWTPPGVGLGTDAQGRPDGRGA